MEITMLAVVCKKLGSAGKLVIESVEDPCPGPDEVLIRVHAAGLNFPDTLVIQGKYQFRPELPFIPGGEASGVIIQCGEDVNGFKPGDRVMTAGMTGAFAEKLCRPARDLVLMPDNMPFETAAGFLVTYGTSYYALKQRARLQSGETLLVLGAAGGVGLAAVDLGAAMGATVIAAASTEDKLDLACRTGATLRVNYTEQPVKETVKSLTAGKGVDVVYDPVGGELSEQALRATAWDGRFLVVGFASGTIPKIPLNLPLLKNNALVGVLYGAWMQREPVQMQQNIKELLELYQTGQLHPLVTQVFEMEQVEEAFTTLEERRAQGKVVIKM